MKTALATVEHPGDERKSVQTRALFDTGSQFSYITEKLRARLALPLCREEQVSLYAFGEREPKPQRIGLVRLRVIFCDGDTEVVTVRVVPLITGCDTCYYRVCSEALPILRGLQLADAYFGQSDATLNVLFGLDCYDRFVRPGKREVVPGVFLTPSKFGDILSGALPPFQNMEHDSRSNVAVTFVSSLQDAPEMWRLESIGIVDDPREKDDEVAEQQFEDTIRLREGRYHVSWPWKSRHPFLPSNFQLSLVRLRSLLQKLRSDPVLAAGYAKVLDEQLKLGMIEPITETEAEGPVHYVPHHPVLREDHATTKIRIVFDASAKRNKSSPSLNECLYRGPLLLRDLAGILLRFRLKRVAIVADIEKAFLQVGLNEDARDVVRFLWLKDPGKLELEQNLQAYRFTRVPFGVISSPFLLAAVLRHHLLAKDSAWAREMLANLYVDNLFLSAHSVEEGSECVRVARELLLEASMSLREFASNVPAVLGVLAPELKQSEKEVKVLGLKWNLAEDTLRIAEPPTDSIRTPRTKREFLSLVANVYDPLGFLSPALLPLKMLVRELWLANMDWDQEISLEFSERLPPLLADLADAPTVTLPRWVGVSNGGDLQLHVYADASKHACCAAAYLRVGNSERAETSLLFAKVRLAPKETTIPRLELLAVLIGARIASFVQKEIPVPFSRRILWTDSKCVMHWLRSTKVLSVFVENRLKEIRNAGNLEFRYVPTSNNPADLGTRPTASFASLRNSMWFAGPDWLALPMEQWPTSDLTVDSETIEKIRSEWKNSEKLCEVSFVLHEPLSPPFALEIARYSSLVKLLRVTATCGLALCKLRKSRAKSDCVGVADLNVARESWDKFVQCQELGEVFRLLSAGKTNVVIRSLRLFLDAKGLIRCGGRLENAEMSRDETNPKLLPEKSMYTRFVVMHYHEKALHAGVSQTLALVRSEYWIPSGRTVVSSVLHRCLKCRKYKGAAYRLPPMAQLPMERVTESHAFAYVGIDFFDPLQARAGKKTLKVYTVIFACIATRAINLELVDDMIAGQFLLALRRFVPRRGKPLQIVSDNALQFGMSKRILEAMWPKFAEDPDVRSYLCGEGIEWKFLIPQAPWMGGFYERLMGIVKAHLRKVLGKLILSRQQLEVLLFEIENIVNSRPLSYVLIDFSGERALTPSNFLLVNNKTSSLARSEILPFEPKEGSGGALLQNWLKGVKHLDAFWKRWRIEYLLALRERQGWEVDQKGHVA